MRGGGDDDDTQGEPCTRGPASASAPASALGARRVAALTVTKLRERTGLIAAHAAQLLAVADGSLDSALQLFEQDPAMFNVPQFFIAPPQHAAAPPTEPAHASASVAVNYASAPAATSTPRLPLAAASTSTAASTSIPCPPRPKHSRSPTAIAARRDKRRAGRKACAAEPRPSEEALRLQALLSLARKQAERSEQVGFSRGVQAERAISKGRKAAKQGSKKQRKARAALARRHGARARAACAS